jgi:hypothetical protein
MTIKYGLQVFFFELTDNDGQNFLAGIVSMYYQKTSTSHNKSKQLNCKL